MTIRSIFRNPLGTMTLILALVFLVAGACGGDGATPPPPQATNTPSPTSTPQPTPTPQPTLDFAALAQQFGSQVQREIASQIAGIEFPEGLTAEDVQAIVAAAISNIPEGLTPEDVQAIVTQAISEIPEGLTAAQMEAAIKNAVDAGVQRAVSEAVAQIPPTATPEPTPDESMMMMSPVVERLLVATDINVESNDPTRSSSFNQPQYVHMYEALVRYDELGQMEPMLAESWEASADKMTWTFNLRKGVKFHKDFGEFSSADLVETLVHEARDESQSTRKALWTNQVIPNLEVVDDHTVIFHLAEPTINFDWILSNRNSTYVFSKDHLDAGGDAAVATSPVGTGPYQYVVRESGAYVLHERTPYEHWRVNPDFDEVQIFNVKEPATRMAELLSGQVHMTLLPPDLERTAVAGGMISIPSKIPHSNPYLLYGGTFYPDKFVGKRTGSFPDLPFSDTFHPATEVPWINKKVREALNRAVDRKAILNTILGGKGELAHVHPYHRTIRGWNPEWEERFEEKYGYDPERAKELLKEAEAEIGQPLDWSKVLFLIGKQPNFPQGPELTQAIFNYWKEIGIPVDDRTEVREHASYNAAFRTSSWGGVAWMDNAGRWEEPSNVQIYLYSGRTAVNFCCQFFENDTIDTLYEELLTVTDLDRRHEILQDIGDVVFEEYAFMPLFHLPTLFTVDPSVVKDHISSGVWGIRDLEYTVAVKK